MSLKIRLSLMMILQFFIWGSWLITFSTYLINTLNFTGTEVGKIYSSMALASIIMPALIGIVADKWISAVRIFSLLHLISAVSLILVARSNNFTFIYYMMMLNFFAYMPTISLSNTVSFIAMKNQGLQIGCHFPAIRALGTIGFIVAMWAVSLAGLEASRSQLYIAAIASLVLSIYSLTLPNISLDTERSSDNDIKIPSWLSRIGLDALCLFRKKHMALFMFFSMLLGSLLQVTNLFGSPFLHDLATPEAKISNIFARYPSMLLSLSQISEVVFILIIPSVMRKFGIKPIIMISMIAWCLRFTFFAYGNFSDTGMFFLISSMIVYGCAFDFFNIAGSMAVDLEVPAKIRAGAQGLFTTLVSGMGPCLGFIISGKLIDHLTINGKRDWHTFWLSFAGYALCLLIVFLITYKNAGAVPLNVNALD